LSDVNVTIDGVVLYCDSSAADIELGKNYSIRKVFLDDLPYKTKITDGNGKLSINYMGSRLYEDERTYFMCLHKDDTYQIQPPKLRPGITITYKDMMCGNQLEKYKDDELSYLHKQFSLLRLFKQGNIGCKEIFLTHKFSVMGFGSNTQNQTSDNVTRNIVDTRVFSLSNSEISECNSFLQSFSGKEYEILKECIDEFMWGLDGTDTATAFEQYNTALEMIFLAKNQQNKKQVLSKRIAVLLGTTPEEIDSLYKKMLNFYRFRSESLHEGNGNHITEIELRELEIITRNVLCKYLAFCKQFLLRDSNVLWKSIKAAKISDLKNQVGVAIKNGYLPDNNNRLIDQIKQWIRRIFFK